VKAKTLCFANAGQTKPLLSSSHNVCCLDSVGVSFPLGMKEDSTYEERSIQLHSGDVLFLMTDGFTEAMNANREIYGTERIERCIRNLSRQSLTAGAMLENISEEIRSHIGDAPQHDDMTMVVLKVL
jgi:sigma-B regulation protein RsbU (phosphoserine phosphatase)